MMVDSPGMIDSPMSRSSTGTRRGSDTSRGYDFEGVVRWFAERADVILLFFDPDKPGTTGETLSILTNSLPGMDHKLHIVLNKVRSNFRWINGDVATAVNASAVLKRGLLSNESLYSTYNELITSCLQPCVLVGPPAVDV